MYIQDILVLFEFVCVFTAAPLCVLPVVTGQFS